MDSNESKNSRTNGLSDSRTNLSIKFNTWFGNEVKKVEITNVHGGSGGYHLYVDHYYLGVLTFYNGRWVGHVNQLSQLTAAHIQELGELIDRETKKAR
jgi:hypothetical protein